MRSRHPDAAASAGLTLMELVVVMGLLAGFLLMLTQLLSTGLSIFGEGETGQALADRSQTAVRATRRALSDVTGPGTEDLAPRDPDGRFLVQPMELGLGATTPDVAGADFVPLIRAAIVLDETAEIELIEPGIRADLAALQLPDEEFEEELALALAQAPKMGRGRMWLFPWPQGDAEGTYLQLRRMRFLPGTVLNFGRQALDPRAIVDVGELAGEDLYQVSEVLVEDLLHFDVRMWSQYTAGWDEFGDRGPERAWDSARAGWLRDLSGEWEFRLDLGEDSLRDPVDDVYPRALQITIVAGESPSQPPQGVLASPLGQGETTARLVNDRYLTVDDGDFVKIGSEWIQVGRVVGTRLQALKRGMRGTLDRGHSRGAGVRSGQTVVFHIPIPFGRDSWNG